MRTWPALTRRRTIPDMPMWGVAVALLVLGGCAGWAALRPEGPPVSEARDPNAVIRESRALVAEGEALVEAVRANDQRHVDGVKEATQARSRLEADREARRPAAVSAARIGYGALAALNVSVGVWLLAVSRRPRPS